MVFFPLRRVICTSTRRRVQGWRICLPVDLLGELHYSASRRCYSFSYSISLVLYAVHPKNPLQSCWPKRWVYFNCNQILKFYSCDCITNLLNSFFKQSKKKIVFFRVNKYLLKSLWLSSLAPLVDSIISSTCKTPKNTRNYA